MKKQLFIWGSIIFIWGSIILMLVTTAYSARVQASDLEYRIYAGVATEHIWNDDPEYNESNDLFQLSVYFPTLYFVTAGTFSNSHYDRSNFAAWGREFKNEHIDDLSWGLMLAAVHGYDGELKTHWQGLIFIPVTYYKYKYFRAEVLGPALNVGIEVPF